MRLKMKLLLIIIIVNVSNITSQNLVLNPSFEEFESCPNSISQLTNCSSISTPNSATTDYYNSCSNNYSSSTPINAAGLQTPRTGNAYIGILTYQKNTHYTELVQCKLKEPLKANRYYKVSYYVSLSEISKFYHKSLGAYFSKDSLTSKHFDFRVQNKKYLIKEMNTELLSNTDTWVLISSLYKAKGSEKFLILGNVYGPLWKGNFLPADVSCVCCSQTTAELCL